MRATRTSDTAIVVAAQAGDPKALDDLVTAYLPLVYTIVRRALGGHADADDVVQDVMLRALRQLRDLRAPESFRPWLAAIAVRQVGTHLQREQLAAERTTALDEATEVPDADADFEGLALLHAELSGQRRQVVRASRWLDAEDRVLLSLWWLETAGELTRSEMAATLGVAVAHAGVRVQRMRNHLDVSRAVVAALDATPGCTALSAAVAGWDGRPGPLWRKRIGRHTRSCVVCARAAAELMPAERLLIGAALLPVPTMLAALLTKSALSGAGSAGSAGATSGASAASVGAAGKAGFVGPLVHAVGTHPFVAAVTAGALAVAAVTTTTWPSPEPSAPAVIAAPAVAPLVGPAATPTARPTVAAALSTGPRSLEAVNATGRFIAVAAFEGWLASVGPGSANPDRERATFEVIPGFADPTCVSLRTWDGWYLRHSSWRLRTSMDQGSEQFRADSTFCARPGSAPGSVSLEASNYPGWFLRHRDDELWVDRSDGSAAFHADSSFFTRAPLAG